MKKVVSILLVLFMMLSFAACAGKSGKVQDALQGSWVAKWSVMGTELYRYYTFKGNKYTTGGTRDAEPSTGTFEVKDSTIHLIPDDGSQGNDLDYTFNEASGVITLWWSDDVQFTKGNINTNYNFN